MTDVRNHSSSFASVLLSVLLPRLPAGSDAEAPSALAPNPPGPGQ